MVTYLPDARSFLKISQKALEEDEINGNLIFGLANILLKNEKAYGPDSPFYSIVYRNNEPSLIALMTPPKNLLLYKTNNFDNSVMKLFAEELYAKNIFIPGITSELNLAESFMENWTRLTNHDPQISMNLRVYKLTKVRECIKPNGIFRKAEINDLDSVIGFITGFYTDTREAITDERIWENADKGIRNNEIFVWDNKGAVSMAMKRRPTKNGMAVSGVFTPAKHRNKGYATAVVAELSRNILDSGKSFCTLFTDLSNPTSNSIYQKIGYEAVCDHISYTFKTWS